MQTLSLPQPIAAPASGRLSWRMVAGALRGDALAAFPPEAFEEEIVIQRFFGRQHILVQRPEAIHHILVENPQNYARLPAVSMVQVLAPQVVAAARALATDLADGDRQPVNLVPRFRRLALDIIGGAIFSLDMARFADELRELILNYAVRLGRPSLADFVLPLAIPTLADIARARFRRRWRRLIGRIIAERAARAGGPAPRDLFDVLAAPDPETGAPPDPEKLGDQVATVVVAGHETTAAGLFWAIYLLARHGGEQDRVAEEVLRLAPDPENAAEILPQLTYTRAVIDEALRLYPPAFVIVRRALGEDVAGDVPVPKGSLVLIAPWVLHRHRRFWAAPQRFDPSRFLPGAAAPPRFAYMPFGAGPRTCVGAPFALTALVLVVATLVRAFRIELAPHRPVSPVGLVTIQPDIPPPFLLRPRPGN